jgi:hypothetical protein
VLGQLYRTLVLDVGKDRADELIHEARAAFDLLTPPTPEEAGSTIQGLSATLVILDEMIDLQP